MNRYDKVALGHAAFSMIVAVLLLCGFCEAAFGAGSPDQSGLAASVLTDARLAEARLEWTGSDGLVTTGPVVSWHKEQPGHVWGGGVFGMLTVTPAGQMPLANLFPWVGDWLGLPETIAVEVRLGAQISAVNVAHGPDLVGEPFVEIGLGPLLFNFRVQIAEGGAVEDLMESRPALFLGLRPIRF
jgi:hypothetical protein